MQTSVTVDSVYNLQANLDVHKATGIPSRLLKEFVQNDYVKLRSHHKLCLNSGGHLDALFL